MAKVRTSVASAMAPIKRIGSKVEAEVDGIVEQRYIETEFRIPIPQNALTKAIGLPEVFVLTWRIKLPPRRPG